MTSESAHIVFSSKTELLRISVHQILYIQADGNRSIICLSGGLLRTVNYQLGDVHRMLADQIGSAGLFVRIGRSIIANIRYVYHISLTNLKLVLMDDSGAQYTLIASGEALKELKELIERIHR